MKVTTKSRYGLKAVIEIAKNKNKPIAVSAISKKEQIAQVYLEQILNKLKKEGVVKSIRGAQGGYVLTKPPEKTSVFDVVNALESDFNLVFCLGKNRAKNMCRQLNGCNTRSVWKEANDAMINVLKKRKIRGLL